MYKIIILIISLGIGTAARNTSSSSSELPILPRPAFLREILIRNGCWPLADFPYLHPVFSESEFPIAVAIQGYFETVASINDKLQTLSVTGSIGLHWKISCAAFGHLKDVQDLEWIQLDANSLWKPIIDHKNTIDYYYLDSGLRSISRMRLSPDGSVTQWLSGIFSSNCAFNFYKFPFDRQKCEILLESFENSKYINLTKHRSQKAPSNTQIGDYHLINSDFTAELNNLNVESIGMTLNQFIFTFHFKRDPNYYIVTLILPVMFLMVLQLTAFFIPNSPERCTFLLTILLAINLIQQVVDANIPHLTDSPLIIYSLLCFTASATFQSCYAIATLMYFGSDNTKVRLKFIRLYGRPVKLSFFLDVLLFTISTMFNVAMSAYVFYQLVID